MCCASPLQARESCSRPLWVYPLRKLLGRQRPEVHLLRPASYQRCSRVRCLGPPITPSLHSSSDVSRAPANPLTRRPSSAFRRRYKKRLHDAMSSPTNSPREPDDVDATAPANPDDHEKTSQEGEPTMDIPYDFEVKEQDRWLPIANGEFAAPTRPDLASLAPQASGSIPVSGPGLTPLPLSPRPCARLSVFDSCTSTDAVSTYQHLPSTYNAASRASICNRWRIRVPSVSLPSAASESRGQPGESPCLLPLRLAPRRLISRRCRCCSARSRKRRRSSRTMLTYITSLQSLAS